MTWPSLLGDSEETHMSIDSFAARGRLQVGPPSDEIYRLGALEAIADVHQLPFSLKVLLENVLRHEDGATVTGDDVEALARWSPASASGSWSFFRCSGIRAFGCGRTRWPPSSPKSYGRRRTSSGTEP